MHFHWFLFFCNLQCLVRTFQFVTMPVYIHWYQIVWSLNRFSEIKFVLFSLDFNLQAKLVCVTQTSFIMSCQSFDSFLEGISVNQQISLSFYRPLDQSRTLPYLVFSYPHETHRRLYRLCMDDIGFVITLAIGWSEQHALSLKRFHHFHWLLNRWGFFHKSDTINKMTFTVYIFKKHTYLRHVMLLTVQ